MNAKGDGRPARIDWRSIVTHDGTIAVDMQQRIVYWGASAQSLLGHAPEEVLGKPCYDVVAGRDSQNYRLCRRNCPVIVNARRGRPTPEYDVLCAMPTGEQRWLNVSIMVFKRNGGASRILHLLRDVTSRRRREDFAQRARAAIDDLLAQEPDKAYMAMDSGHLLAPSLSKREAEVLRLLASGLSTPQIAQELGIQVVTARNHITRLLTKLGVENRLKAVVYASEHHLI